MKKNNTKKIWLSFFFILSIVSGYYLYKVQWIILSVIFFTLGSISLLIAFYNKNQETQNKKIIMCPKCKIENQLYNLNNNHYSTIFIYREHDSIIKSEDNLDIFLLICFKCKKITKWAIDTDNNSGNAKYGFQYFETRIVTKEDLIKATQDAEQSCSVHSLDKLKVLSNEI